MSANGTVNDDLPLTDRERLMLTSLVKVVDRRYGHGVRDVTLNVRDLPAPQVTNEVRTPEVNVRNEVNPTPVTLRIDTEPLAAVIRELKDELSRDRAVLIDALARRDELLSQLLQVLAAVPAPQVTVPVPSVKVDVAAPEVTVQVPPAKRERRSLVIKHDDGTKSTIEG